MPKPSLSATVFLLSLLGAGVSACHRDEPAPTNTATTPASAPDPDAPPPGSQAAEAIGADGAAAAPVTRP